MTFNFSNFNSIFCYVVDLFHNFQTLEINLYFITIITTITIGSFILFSANNVGKTVGKWIAAGGAFEVGSHIVNAGIDAIKEGINSIQNESDNSSNNGGNTNTDGNSNTGGNSGGSSGTQTGSQSSSEK